MLNFVFEFLEAHQTYVTPVAHNVEVNNTANYKVSVLSSESHINDMITLPPNIVNVDHINSLMLDVKSGEKVSSDSYCDMSRNGNNVKFIIIVCVCVNLLHRLVYS